MATTEEALSRRERRRTQTREALYEAAMDLFARNGFDQVTVEMITDRADVAKGTFFNHFTSKEAVVALFFENQLETATAVLAIADDRPGGAWEAIHRTVCLLAEHSGRSRPLARTLLGLALTNDTVRAANQHMKAEAQQAGARLIAWGQQRGEIRADVPAEEIATHIRAFYFAVLNEWATADGDGDLRQEIDRRLTLMREGLLPRGEKGE